MSIYNFVNPANGQNFEIKGPPGLSRTQAKAIFDQQVQTGSLVGFNSGDVLSAATQVVDQLPGAQAQLSQALSGRGGDLTGVIRNTPSTGDIAGQAQSVATRLQSSVSFVANQLPVTNGINIADFAKQGTALVPIQKLSVPDVTAAMSSVSKLVSQPASEISNNLGVGKFGFDAKQLEAAGILKPGTASTWLSQGTNSLTDVLKSPAVYTGKNGINNLDSLLSSVPKQDQIQQQLMSQGLGAVSAAGIPVAQLTSGPLAGLANAAAKSVSDTLALAKGLPLPAGIKSTLDKFLRDGAFAANFSAFKVNSPMKEFIVPVAAVDTTDRVTVDAASQRIVGNDKVPEFQY